MKKWAVTVAVAAFVLAVVALIVRRMVSSSDRPAPVVAAAGAFGGFATDQGERPKPAAGEIPTHLPAATPPPEGAELPAMTEEERTDAWATRARGAIQSANRPQQRQLEQEVLEWGPKAGVHLANLLEGERSGIMAHFLIRLIRKLEAREAVPALRGVARAGPDRRSQMAAVGAVATLGGADEAGFLEELARSAPDEAVRAEAAKEAERIRNNAE